MKIISQEEKQELINGVTKIVIKSIRIGIVAGMCYGLTAMSNLFT